MVLLAVLLLLCSLLLCSAAADSAGIPRPSLRSRRLEQRQLQQQQSATAALSSSSDTTTGSRGVLSEDEVESIISSQQRMAPKAPKAYSTPGLMYTHLENPLALEEIASDHFTFYSLDDLFPTTFAFSSSSSSRGEVHQSFSDIFDTNSAFRTGLRVAMREDLSTGSSDTVDAEDCEKALYRDPRSSVMGSWMDSTNPYSHLSDHFRTYGMSNIDGPLFVGKISSLCYGRATNSGSGRGEVFGSFIDILGVANRRLPHSWHQDSGRDQLTVMVGFPKRNCYTGPGVFSHIIKLSHRLPRHERDCPRLLADLLPPRQCSDQGAAAATAADRIRSEQLGEEHIVRPLYSRHREVLVYNDRDVFHSAPDVQLRESLWRFIYLAPKLNLCA